MIIDKRNFKLFVNCLLFKMFGPFELKLLKKNQQQKTKNCISATVMRFSNILQFKTCRNCITKSIIQYLFRNIARNPRISNNAILCIYSSMYVHVHHLDDVCWLCARSVAYGRAAAWMWKRRRARFDRVRWTRSVSFRTIANTLHTTYMG